MKIFDSNALCQAYLRHSRMYGRASKEGKISNQACASYVLISHIINIIIK